MIIVILPAFVALVVVVAVVVSIYMFYNHSHQEQIHLDTKLYTSLLDNLLHIYTLDILSLDLFEVEHKRSYKEELCNLHKSQLLLSCNNEVCNLDTHLERIWLLEGIDFACIDKHLVHMVLVGLHWDTQVEIDKNTLDIR